MIRVLMIGNSYTFYNDQPAMLEALLRENGVEAHVDSVTCGGRHLIENLGQGDPYAERIDALLAETHYDVLILQGHSLESILAFEEFEEGVLGLCEKIGATRTVLYVTWGRHPDNPTLAEHGWTHEGMTAAIDAAYAKAAAKVGAACSRVGAAFSKARAEVPDVELYHADKHHPSPAGTALAALCHFCAITGTPAEKTESLPLSPAEAAAFCRICATL